jgi:hypothetical protein
MPHCAFATDRSAVLTAHYQTHHALALQDVYKLLYQRVFGPEHSVEKLAAAQARLVMLSHRPMDRPHLLC